VKSDARKGKGQEVEGQSSNAFYENPPFDAERARALYTRDARMTIGDEWRTACESEVSRVGSANSEKKRNWSSGAQKGDSTRSDVDVHRQKDLPDLPEVESPLPMSPVSRKSRESSDEK
jgi:hypothetical protein